MRLQIEHITTFDYDLPISEAYTEMRLAPLDQGGQRRAMFRLETEPEGEVTRYLDRYANEVHYFDVLQPHQQLRVIARSEIITIDQFREEKSCLSLIEQHDYLTTSHYTPVADSLRTLAKITAEAGDTVSAAAALTAAVHGAIKYEKGATTVKTNAVEALDIGKGVCQDYAHVMISAARSVGLPARYVSGYLFSPDAPEMASHAWVDLYIKDIGWLAFDPTHNCAQSARHVRVGIGRDYADVPPTRGVYKGNAKEKMDVHVKVHEA
jgi:transglutaminase-like putative cysteine protease